MALADCLVWTTMLQSWVEGEGWGETRGVAENLNREGLSA